MTTHHAEPTARSDPPIAIERSMPDRPARQNDGAAPGDGQVLRGRSRRRARDAYRRLAMQLEVDLGQSASGHTIMVTAADTRTTSAHAALELAHVLTDELGKRVLIIDGSFASRGISASLGYANSPGLCELLNGHALEEPFQQTRHASISLLPRGKGGAGAMPRLAQGDVQRLLAQAAAVFDYVLIASGPVLEDSRCLVFPALTDRVLMLAVERRTLLGDMCACRKALEDCGARQIGLVLTKPRRRLLG